MDDTNTEQQFLDTVESDRLLAFSMALATELWVTRARLHRIEDMLTQAGIVSAGTLDTPPDDRTRAAMQPELDRYVESLMNCLKGQQASVPASDDILQRFS